MTTLTDTLGRGVTFVYNSNGQLQSVTGFLGRTVTYTYDQHSDLIAVTSRAVTGTPNGNDLPGGKATGYTYQNHNLFTVTPPNEMASGGPPVLVNTYNSAGQIVSQTYGGTNASNIAAGGTYTYTYTARNAGVAW